MTTFRAIAPGTDLTSHARALSRTRDEVMGGASPRSHPRNLVARSWSRVMDMGLDPDGTNPRHHLPAEQVEHRRRTSPLAGVLPELRGMVAAAARASESLMVVTDEDGVVLWRDGATRTRSGADRLGFGEGSRWTESAVGTNAIGTALAEGHPVELFAAEHFEQRQMPWYCTAAPVHDPRTGRVLGVVDLSGPALTLHPMTGALVAGAARMAEMRLAEQHRRRLDRIRDGAGPRVAAREGPFLLVDDDGWVAHGDGLPLPERVAAPQEGHALAVPGIGACLPDPVGEGWLLRPCSRSDGGTVDLRLDLAGAPSAEVAGGGRRWRTGLTTRHAEILLMLYLAGPDGIGAATLSRALHGDDAHVVSVRAEVSRLRRVLGAVLLSRPYRCAEGVRLEVDGGGVARLSENAFVREHACERVREAVRAMEAGAGGAAR
ncbi:GAF domain-containing protein [Nocardiopsis sp. HNM0947]|uniref:GAF domain-containing protein n=1 Tax=Nocardiopsis coralli TaxID=2772213 RepID=A0ABR9PC01_9ACTN|nr:GAF domain-containing protein [Nocardiopsis coralli]MBE3001365.1 GAF domain-containing protein [Nocardiopsis coralli]